MDPTTLEDLKNSVILLTPPTSYSRDMRLKTFDRDTFLNHMLIFRYTKQVECNSTAVQFDTKEKIQCGLMRIASTETQHNDQNDASTQTASLNFGNVRAAETQTVCEDDRTDPIGELQSEKCDFGAQVNMEQMGVVRPVVRGGKGPEDTKNSLSGVGKQRKHPPESTNQGNEEDDNMKASVKFLQSPLEKLKNLVSNEARENPAGHLSLWDDYLDHICDILQMIISSSKLAEIQEFSRSKEKNLSNHRRWNSEVKNDRKRNIDNPSLTNAEIQPKYSRKDNKSAGTSTSQVRPGPLALSDRKARPKHADRQHHRNKYRPILNRKKDNHYRSPIASHRRNEQYDHQARQYRDGKMERTSPHPSESRSLPRIDQRSQVSRSGESPAHLSKRQPSQYNNPRSRDFDDYPRSRDFMDHPRSRDFDAYPDITAMNPFEVAELRANRHMHDQFDTSENCYPGLETMSAHDNTLYRPNNAISSGEDVGMHRRAERSTDLRAIIQGQHYSPVAMEEPHIYDYAS